MIQRFSSRGQLLSESFLAPRLRGARSYDRIAGYFSSSILEVAGEELESITGPVRIVCNSSLHPLDVATAKAAEEAQRLEWCAALDLDLDAVADEQRTRFERLHAFLASGRIRVKVLPEARFGLAHGKAGVITLEDGRRTSFLGSVNETKSGWKLNHELLWEDDSPDAVDWVQAEFEALWGHAEAVDLAKFILEDAQRLAHRTVISSVDAWRQTAEPAAAAIIEAPVNRESAGLWPHQKHFVKLAFDAHQTPFGARFVLADMVGLGKTLQLAMAAQLMALQGDRPVLVLAPKTLIWQWQEEFTTMLGAPSAVWNGRAWVDENEIEHSITGPTGIRRCPRRIGIVSQGIVTARTPAADELARMEFECVIVDEAHRARRKNLAAPRDAAEPNNLLEFLQALAKRAHSLLLATATPVQMAPVEAWDMLELLARGRENVLGNSYSRWRRPVEALELAMGRKTLPADRPGESWDWIRNPLPPANDGLREVDVLRRNLEIPDTQAVVTTPFDDLRGPDRQRVARIAEILPRENNPFIRHIIRRSREWLETEIDPVTHEPYLPRIGVELHGEGAIELPVYLQDAYQHAEAFSKLIGKRLPGGGFLRTLLLRRVGSSIAAGRITAQKLLDQWRPVPDEDDLAADDDDNTPDQHASELSRTMTPTERTELETFVAMLDANQARDPKHQVILECLRTRGWLELGCIVFSQYFDSIAWLAEQLARDFPKEPIAIYAGGSRSGVRIGDEFKSSTREDLKKRVRLGELRLVLGTDAASEGLNLQRLGTLINLDLPWNPTRLEQRKGRIQRIGQRRDKVDVYNMRYAGSVEDRVHDLLSERLKQIHTLFGQLPDVLEDVWVDVALGNIEKAKQTIDEVPTEHPFDLRYHRIERIDWETCTAVLDDGERRRVLTAPWGRG